MGRGSRRGGAGNSRLYLGRVDDKEQRSKLGQPARLCAIVTALAPICADNFRRDQDTAARLVELKKVSTWDQARFIGKGGWAKMPGIESADSAMARACATLILSDNVAEKS